MKIRNGFVSNSSSSSFLIYGTVVDKDIIEQLLGGSEYDDLDKFHDMGLSVYNDEWSCWVGLSPTDILDNETGKQFKERVEELIEKAFGKKMQCAYHSEVVYS